MKRGEIMKNAVFGEVSFNFGWEKRGSVILFNRPYSVVIRIKSFRETDLITVAQEEGYHLYRQNEKKYCAKIEQALIEYCEDADQAKERFIPSTLIFQRDGSFALMIDDDNDVENGLVFTLSPVFSLQTTDEYL